MSENGGTPIGPQDNTREIVVRHEADLRTFRSRLDGIEDAIRAFAVKLDASVNRPIQWQAISVATVMGIALAGGVGMFNRLSLQPVSMMAEQAYRETAAARTERDRGIIEDFKALREEFSLLDRRYDDEREGRWIRESQRSETERSRMWEQIRADGAHIARLAEQLNEVETQFDWGTDALNSALAHSDRLDAVMWKKVFGEDLPAIVGNGVGPEGKTRRRR